MYQKLSYIYDRFDVDEFMHGNCPEDILFKIGAEGKKNVRSNVTFHNINISQQRVVEIWIKNHFHSPLHLSFVSKIFMREKSKFIFCCKFVWKWSHSKRNIVRRIHSGKYQFPRKNTGLLCEIYICWIASYMFGVLLHVP